MGMSEPDDDQDSVAAVLVDAALDGGYSIDSFLHPLDVFAFFSAVLAAANGQEILLTAGYEVHEARPKATPYWSFWAGPRVVYLSAPWPRSALRIDAIHAELAARRKASDTGYQAPPPESAAEATKPGAPAGSGASEGSGALAGERSERHTTPAGVAPPAPQGRCRVCGDTFAHSRRGRLRLTCSSRCRQRLRRGGR